MLSTLDCSPACFERMCAHCTCTEIPPCGGGYGPTKSTFIDESPAPQLENNESPDLQVQWTSSVVQINQALDVRFSKQPALDAPSRQQKIAYKRTQLTAEPTPQRNGKATFGSMQNFVWKNAFHS